LAPSAPGPNVPFPPQEAELVEEIPAGPKWQYEPKWDGFRGVLENDNGELALWSRNGRPLLRYFPELRPLGDLLRHTRRSTVRSSSNARGISTSMPCRTGFTGGVAHPEARGGNAGDVHRLRRAAMERRALHTLPLTERRAKLLEVAKGSRSLSRPLTSRPRSTGCSGSK
jgi:hypothetical protein